jgi:hypothetical protein
VFVALGHHGGFDLPQFKLPTFGPAANAGGWSSNNLYLRQAGDVNGDGLADIVGFGDARVYVSLATGDGNFALPTAELASFGPGAGGWSNNNLYPRHVADVNGDGLADLVGFGGSFVYVALAIGGGHFANPTAELASFGPNSGGWDSADHYPRALADVNGDGRADIVGFGGEYVYVALATAGGHFAGPIHALQSFGASAAGGGWSSNDRYPRVLGDINADGRADIVGFGDSKVYYALGQADGTFTAPVADVASFGYSAAAGGWSSANLYPRLLGDMTDDGRADIIGFGDLNVFVSQSLDFVNV